MLRVRGRNAAERSRRTEGEGQGWVPVIEEHSAAALRLQIYIIQLVLVRNRPHLTLVSNPVGPLKNGN